MPKTPPAPTKIQLAADALIAAPKGSTFESYRDAIKAIRKLYYAALGADRRRALSKRLDEHLAGLSALAHADAKIAARARSILPPKMMPKPQTKPKPQEKPKPQTKKATKKTG